MAKKNLLVALAAAASFFLFPSGSSSYVETKNYPLQPTSPIVQRAIDDFYKTDEMKGLEKQIDNHLNYRIDDFWKDTEVCLLARTLLGEVDICAEIERIGVGFTALTRKSWGLELKNAILQDRAYSCYNKGTERIPDLKNPLEKNKKEFLYSLKLAEGLLEGKYKDPTGGATHYHLYSIPRPDSWKNLKRIGRIKVGETKDGKPIWSLHVFYK